MLVAQDSELYYVNAGSGYDRAIVDQRVHDGHHVRRHDRLFHVEAILQVT